MGLDTSARIKKFIKEHGIKFAVLFFLMFGVYLAIVKIFGLEIQNGLGSLVFVLAITLIMYVLGVVKLNI